MRATGFVLLCSLALACAGSSSRGSEPEATISVGEGFALARGRSVSIAGETLRLTFSDVKGDSRCPRNVVCVWAGDAAIVVHAASGGETRDLELHTNATPRAAAAFGHELELIRLEPYPEDPAGIPPEQYVAHLVLR